MRPLHVIAVLLLGVAIGCGSPSRMTLAHESSAGPRTDEFRAWEIIHVRSGAAVAFDTWMDELADLDVIYLGEEHDNRFHVQAAIKVLEALLAKGRSPVLGIEMFAWDGQQGLERYVSGEAMTKQQFVEESHLKQNWPGNFEAYEPLIEFARTRHLRVMALNPPLALVRLVSKSGLAEALTNPDLQRWGMRDEFFEEQEEYRDRIVRQLRACHAGLSDERYESFYEASVFRDEGMAKTIATYLKTVGSRRPVVSYTGAGHIQYKLPVPNRVSRRMEGAIKQVTIYMASLEPDHQERIEELLTDHVADYVWITPLGEHGPPRRCG